MSEDNKKGFSGLGDLLSDVKMDDALLAGEKKSPLPEGTSPKPTDTTKPISSKVIFGIIIALIGYAALNDNSSKPSGTSYQSPASYNNGTVNNGQFRCSRYDSDQADSLSPRNESQLTSERQSLDTREASLNGLKSQIDTSNVNQYSDQSEVDYYNQMIAQYNAQLATLKYDENAYQMKIDQFNTQVQAHNNYLLAHCRSGG